MASARGYEDGAGSARRMSASPAAPSAAPLGALGSLRWLAPEPSIAIETAVGSLPTDHRPPLREPTHARSVGLDGTAPRTVLEPLPCVDVGFAGVMPLFSVRHDDRVRCARHRNVSVPIGCRDQLERRSPR